MAELDGVICSDVHAVFDIHGAIAIGSHAGKYIKPPFPVPGSWLPALRNIAAASTTLGNLSTSTTMAGKRSREYTNPEVYNAHHKAFQAQDLPSGQSGWVERARNVAAILAQDAPQRDIDNKAPAAEISLLKSSGLLKVLGPKAYGGGGEAWDTGYKVIREVAKGDGSLGMLLGYHLLWSTTANVVGTEDQARSVQKVITEQNLV